MPFMWLQTSTSIILNIELFKFLINVFFHITKQKVEVGAGVNKQKESISLDKSYHPIFDAWILQAINMENLIEMLLRDLN